MIKRWSPIHVNVFTSGKVVVTGIKQHNLRICHVIRHWLIKKCIDQSERLLKF